jgi:hypothetical protein
MRNDNQIGRETRMEGEAVAGGEAEGGGGGEAAAGERRRGGTWMVTM